MGFSDAIMGFFTPEAGQARTRALNSAIDDYVTPFIPPELRQPINAVSQFLAPQSPTEAALMPVGGALASKAASLATRGAQKFSNAMLSKAFNAADDAAAATTRRAVIRPDDVFRGHGTPRVPIDTATKPYAVRVTGYDQIDDMVRSGLVRPKPGGYGKQQSPQIYFGESDTVGSTIFTKIGPDKVRLVTDTSRVAGREGPIPIDELKHIFALRNGEEVDILEEILRRNMEWKP